MSRLKHGGKTHEKKEAPLVFSPEDGDLLILILLAVLAGEDGCADLVAALAFLLTVR